MTAIRRRRIAISAIGASVVRVGIRRAASTAVEARLEGIADAMGPGVIRADGETLCCATLAGQNQPVIVAGTPVVDFVHKCEVLTERRVFQYQRPPLIRIGRSYRYLPPTSF